MNENEIKKVFLRPIFAFYVNGSIQVIFSCGLSRLALDLLTLF